MVCLLIKGIIVFGGGMSKAFNVYGKELIKTLKKKSSIFKRNPCLIKESSFKSKSHMVGAALNLKRR